METNLWFQTTNMTLGQGNEICPNNDCKYEFQDVTFNEFGNDRYISGTLKMEDKSTNPTQGNFTSFKYYDLSGNFVLQNSKESPNEKILYYVGNLGMEQKSDAPGKVQYTSKNKVRGSPPCFLCSQIALHHTNLFELKFKFTTLQGSLPCSLCSCVASVPLFFCS